MLSQPMYSISYYKSENSVRLTWLPGTEGMTDEDFKETLEVFAESARQHHAKRLMVDVREFKHRPSVGALAWRDKVTVPKYIRGGAKKIAWLWPGSMASAMPAYTETRYENRNCSTETEALAWVLG